MKPFLIFSSLLLFSFSGFAQERLFPCNRGDKMGFCNEQGQVKIEAVYEKVLPFSGPLAAVSIDGFWWFINQKGLLRFNSRGYDHESAPQPEKGIYRVSYFDPIFADVTEYYNKNGLPVKLLEPVNPDLDTLSYSMFNAPEAVQLAQTKLGIPYGTDGLDCSGFVRFIYGNFGIVLPYFTKEIITKGHTIPISEGKPGDLIFFRGANAFDPTPNHVGMIVSVSGGKTKFIHASTSKGICQNITTDSYFKPRFLECRRIFD